jgi:hypothetical protein
VLASQTRESLAQRSKLQRQEMLLDGEVFARENAEPRDLLAAIKLQIDAQFHFEANLAANVSGHAATGYRRSANPNCLTAVSDFCSHFEACLYPTVCILRAKDSLAVPNGVVHPGLHP